MSDSLVTDHEFRPSKRGDSCDFTYWQVRGPWLVCDYPASAHDEPLRADLKPRAFRIGTADANFRRGGFSA